MKNKEKITVKPRLSQITRYTKEEKYSLFVEGRIKVPSAVRNRKKYHRASEKRRYEDF